MEFYLIFVRYTRRKKNSLVQRRSLHVRNLFIRRIVYMYWNEWSWVVQKKNPSSRFQWSYPFRIPNVNDRLQKKLCIKLHSSSKSIIWFYSKYCIDHGFGCSWNDTFNSFQWFSSILCGIEHMLSVWHMKIASIANDIS